jgi:hypothetical protein
MVFPQRIHKVSQGPKLILNILAPVVEWRSCAKVKRRFDPDEFHFDVGMFTPATGDRAVPCFANPASYRASSGAHHGSFDRRHA